MTVVPPNLLNQNRRPLFEEEQDKPSPSKTKTVLALTAVKLSNVGKVRDHQEDAVDFVPPPVPARKGQLFIVADGMGGHNAGEVASSMAVTEIKKAYYGDRSADVQTSLANALRRANAVIYNHALNTAGRTGMGSTAVVMVVRGKDVCVANVGDSRAYILRNGELTQITRDHSWVQEQVEAGVLTGEQAETHPQQNIITRALGPRPTIEPDFFGGEVQAGDSFLLCSDGLHKHVSDETIQQTLNELPLEQAARRLIELANEAGGTDNISVVIAHAEETIAPVKSFGGGSINWVLLAEVVGGILILAVLAYLGVSSLIQRSQNNALPTAVAAAPTIELPTDVAATAEPTATPAEVAEETATPVADTPTPEAVEEATATPAPTDTPVPPTSTPAEPTELLSSPLLVKPETGEEISGLAKFEWRWPGELAPDQAFELRIWKDGQTEKTPARAPTRSSFAFLSVNDLPAVQQGGAGTYFWTVVVVQIQTASDIKPIGREAQERRFIYQP